MNISLPVKSLIDMCSTHLSRPFYFSVSARKYAFRTLSFNLCSIICSLIPRAFLHLLTGVVRTSTSMTGGLVESTIIRHPAKELVQLTVGVMAKLIDIPTTVLLPIYRILTFHPHHRKSYRNIYMQTLTLFHRFGLKNNSYYHQHQ